jgi:phosphoserine phosphatase
MNQVAVFTDIDGVLTHHAINMELARLLRVEKELQVIEDAFAAGGTTDEFNDRFIPLFRSKDFNRGFAEAHFDDIRLRDKTHILLEKKNVDVYLVSSGPSYYVDLLAGRFKIPDGRWLCSNYRFDAAGGLTADVEAINSVDKHDWVARRVRDYRITIGVGNSIEQDGPFLSRCSVQVVMGKLDSRYVCINELGPLLGMIDRLRNAMDGHGPTGA